MYCYWGYFNRHMAQRRRCEEAVFGGQAAPSGRAWLPPAAGESYPRRDTQYGAVTKVW